jgi:hypothetical protein
MSALFLKCRAALDAITLATILCRQRFATFIVKLSTFMIPHELYLENGNPLLFLLRLFAAFSLREFNAFSSLVGTDRGHGISSL